MIRLDDVKFPNGITRREYKGEHKKCADTRGYARLINCLQNGGFDSLEDALIHPCKELLKIKNFGYKSLEVLKEIAEKNGLEFLSYQVYLAEKKMEKIKKETEEKRQALLKPCPNCHGLGKVLIEPNETE